MVFYPGVRSAGTLSQMQIAGVYAAFYSAFYVSSETFPYDEAFVLCRVDYFKSFFKESCLGCLASYFLAYYDVIEIL